jgi:hypothetical protein
MLNDVNEEKLRVVNPLTCQSLCYGFAQLSIWNSPFEVTGFSLLKYKIELPVV